MARRRILLPGVRDERGYILITTVLISMVMLTLGAVVVSLSFENSAHSSSDRRRLQAIDAAEAGIDYYFSQLQSTTPSSAPCSVTKTLSITPPASFTVTPYFYDTTTSPATALTCPPPSRANAVVLRSTGVGSAAQPVRTMEAWVSLVPIQGGGFGSNVIFADRSVSFKANATIGGTQYNDATVYTNGNVSSAANAVFGGDVIAQGTATLGSNSEVKGSISAGGAVTISSGGVVRLNATSSTSSIAVNSGKVYGDAQAGTTITTQGSGAILGNVIPNSPTPAPTAQPYPTYTFNAADWTSAGYTLKVYGTGNNTDCTNAESFIRTGIASGSYVVQIPTSCALTFSNPITVHGNLAIVANGPVTFSTNTKFTAQTGTGPWNVFLFGGMSGTAPCDITTNPNSGFGPNLVALVYTPQACSVNMNSNSGLASGQIYSGVVNWNANINFSFKQVVIPGTNPSGYKQNVHCIREVVTGSAVTVPTC